MIDFNRMTRLPPIDIFLNFSNVLQKAYFQVRHMCVCAQSCPTLSDPMDCSPPGSSVHGIFQARILEWVAISYSNHCHCWPELAPVTPVEAQDGQPSSLPMPWLLSHCEGQLASDFSNRVLVFVCFLEYSCFIMFVLVSVVQQSESVIQIHINNRVLIRGSVWLE